MLYFEFHIKTTRLFIDYKSMFLDKYVKCEHAFN